MLNSTRTATSATPLYRLPAIGTFFDAAVTEIFTVHLAVTTLAKRDAISNVKTQFGILRPRLDMVRMNATRCYTAMLTCAIVSKVYRDAPLFEGIAKTRTFFIERTAVFPCRGVWAGFRLTRTMSRTVLLIVMVCLERLATIFTLFFAGIIANVPARARAVFRATCFAIAALKYRAANFAGKLLTTTAQFSGICQPTRTRAESLPFIRRFELTIASLAMHCFRLPDAVLRAMYYIIFADVKQDVILRRAEAEGLTVERAE